MIKDATTANAKALKLAQRVRTLEQKSSARSTTTVTAADNRGMANKLSGVKRTAATALKAAEDVSKNTAASVENLQADIAKLQKKDRANAKKTAGLESAIEQLQATVQV